MSFLRNDYVIWKNFVLRLVNSKIMYWERINIIEKVYANKNSNRQKNDLWQEWCEKLSMNLLNEWIWDYGNSIKTSDMRL